jgi:hypothetical protein
MDFCRSWLVANIGIDVIRPKNFSHVSILRNSCFRCPQFSVRLFDAFVGRRHKYLLLSFAFHSAKASRRLISATRHTDHTAHTVALERHHSPRSPRFLCRTPECGFPSAARRRPFAIVLVPSPPAIVMTLLGQQQQQQVSMQHSMSVGRNLREHC